MSLEASLHEAYQEWRRLAEAQADAIQTRNWPLLAACQHSVALLQERITPLTTAVKLEWASLGKAAATAKEQVLRATIAELIELERRNQTLLGCSQDEVRVQMAELDKSSLNLKRIQRSYATARSGAWHSFS